MLRSVSTLTNPLFAAASINSRRCLAFGGQLTKMLFSFSSLAPNNSTQGSLGQVQDGAKRLAQIILGASHLAQSIVPSMLIRDDPDMNEWKQRLRTDLEDQAMVLSSRLSSIQGLEVIPPQGAMYIMVRILVEEFDLSNDEEFASQLLREENVFVLPGSAFQMSNYIRLVFCSDKATLEEASDRITEFCNRHRRQ